MFDVPRHKPKGICNEGSTMVKGVLGEFCKVTLSVHLHGSFLATKGHAACSVFLEAAWVPHQHHRLGCLLTGGGGG